MNTSHIPPSDSISQEMETNQTNGNNQINTELTGDGVITDEEQVETSFNPTTDPEEANSKDNTTVSDIHVKFCTLTQ